MTKGWLGNRIIYFLILDLIGYNTTFFVFTTGDDKIGLLKKEDG
jgi:hypothetical protein